MFWVPHSVPDNKWNMIDFLDWKSTLDSVHETIWTQYCKSTILQFQNGKKGSNLKEKHISFFILLENQVSLVEKISCLKQFTCTYFHQN